MAIRILAFRALILSAAGCGISWADTINTNILPNGDITGLEAIQWNSSAGLTPTTITGTGNNQDGNDAVSVLDLSNNGLSTYTFHDNFAAGQGSISAGTINGNSYGFVDTFVLNLPASMASGFAFSLDLCAAGCSGETNLTARLYYYSVAGIQNLTIGGVGAPANGGLVSAWSPSSNGTVSSTAFSTPTLAPGEYVLQIAGIQLANATGGSYSASIGVTPVPLPATLPLMIGGVAMLGFSWRRRRDVPRLAHHWTPPQDRSATGSRA
jgi:hypothetical protein